MTEWYLDFIDVDVIVQYSDRPTLQQCDVINGSIQITDDLNIYQRIMRSTSLLKSIRALVNVP